MRITKGKVVDGQIVLEGESLSGGAVVRVLVSDERTLTLIPEEEALFWKRLLKRIGETWSTSKTFLSGFRRIADAANQSHSPGRPADTGGTWWLANRPKAPEPFKEDLQRAFDLISRQPGVGARATNVKLKGILRIHLQPHSVFSVLSGPCNSH